MGEAPPGAETQRAEGAAGLRIRVVAKVLILENLPTGIDGISCGYQKQHGPVSPSVTAVNGKQKG